jgi:hypothetical protein
MPNCGALIWVWSKSLSTEKRPVPANAEPGTTDQTGAGPVPVIRDRRMRALPATKPLLSTR